MSPGIDMPAQTISMIDEQLKAQALALKGKNRIMVFGCGDGPNLNKVVSSSVGVVKLACIGQLPPSFIDYVLSRDFADGVVLTGCRENSCTARFGVNWTEDRLAGRRDPHLRRRVPRERIKTLWAGALGTKQLADLLKQFSAELERLPAIMPPQSEASAVTPTDPATDSSGANAKEGV